MKTRAGLWIDHRKAVIVLISGEKEETKIIQSNVERQPGRVAGVRSTASHEAQQLQADDSRDREFTYHLQRYYDQVIAVIRDADGILIFGPGEAKGELRKRLEHDKPSGRVLAVETNDKMTDHEIAEKIRERFPTPVSEKAA
ncbi:MAG: hypothetical protein WCV00_04585 [Verrucomicrobiia bacterium]|jgi:stalled ribosome rescue protein Dom34